MKANGLVQRCALPLLVLFLLILVGPSPALAEWTASFYGGKAHTLNSDLEIHQPSLATAFTLHDVSWDDQSFEGPIYYGIRFGYFFKSEPHLGLEGEFIHLKAVSEAERTVAASGTFRGLPLNQEVAMGDVVQHFEISHGVNFLLLNVVGRYGFLRDERYPVGRVRFVARAGLGPTFPHPESVIQGQSLSHYELNGVGFGGGIACEASLSRNLFGFVEYKRTYVDVEVDVPDGSASTALHTNHFIFGLGLSF